MTQYLTFFVADEYYAINLERVLEIIDIADVIKVSGRPKYVGGVVSVMGRNIPVVNMRNILDRPKAEAGLRQCILLVDAEDAKIGCIVDKIDEVTIAIEGKELPEYITEIDVTTFLTAEQMHVMQDLEHWSPAQKKIQIKPIIRALAGNNR